MRLALLALVASFAAAPVLASAQTTTSPAGTKMAPNGSNAAAASHAATGTTPSTGMGTGTATGTGMGSSTASSGGSGSVGQYSSESAANSACSGDTVVWANATSKALHMSGDRYFGKSKHGFFTCEKQALAGGYHVAGRRGSHKHSKTA